VDSLRLDMSWVDYLILAMYFAVVLGIGFVARRSIKTSLDFFLSGRSLPAWVTGLAFIAANLGALEILGMAANGAQYGVATVHFYWIGAVPAMVFLGIVMMPFYYGSKVRSVPEYLRLRFNRPTHLFNALTFAFATVLIAGVNLYALAIVIEALLGWPIWLAIVVAAAFVLAYITLGGLSSAIYNEVLQFFLILAGLVPLVIVGPRRAARGSSPPGAARESVTSRARWPRTGSPSRWASASSCPSATGPPTSPRCSGPCRPKTCPRPVGRR
jgi:SSS family solute:Na+ symporter